MDLQVTKIRTIGGMSASETFSKKRVTFAITGMLLALLSGVGTSVNGYFSNAVQAVIGTQVDQSTLAMQIICIIIMLGVFEFGAAVCGFLINVKKGVPITEYRRIWNVKPTRIVILNALLSGPVGTACFMAGTLFCGPTYAACMNAMAPLFAAIGARIFLKEKVNLRVFIGILIVIGGVVMTCISPYDSTGNFYLGLVLLVIAPLCFAAESLITGHILDAQDAIEVCTMYRHLGASIMNWIIAFIGLIIMGKLDVIPSVIGTMFGSTYMLVFLVLGILGVAINVLGIYAAVARCGSAKSMALQNAAPIWTIPIGLLFAALGIAPYNVTLMAVIAAFVVVIGVVLIVAKPSELFSLRDYE